MKTTTPFLLLCLSSTASATFYGRFIEECGKNIMVDAAGIPLNAGELYWIDDSRNYVL